MSPLTATRVRTTVVGSWPIPFGLKPRLTRYYKGETSDAEAHEVLQAAARIVIDEQRACGLDQVMGGEVFAPDFVHHVPPRLTGLDLVRKRDHRAGAEGIGRYRINGDLSAPNGTGHALAYRREKAIEPALDKAAVPSPLTMTLPFSGDPLVTEQLENVARLVEHEVLEMMAAGVSEIQLDAPFEAILCVVGSRKPEDLVPWIVYPFRKVEGICRTVHFCLGDMGRRPATQEQHLRHLIPLISALDGHVDRVHLECSYSGQWQERDLLRNIPASIEVIAGIADVKAKPPGSDALRERIEDLLRVLPPDRLLVSSSCGCGRVPHDEAILLMRQLVQAAHPA